MLATPMRPPAAPRTSTLRQDILWVTALFAVWRVGLFIVTYIGSRIIEPSANGGPGAAGPERDFDYWSSWAQWDGGNFLAIARDGYEPARLTAFFPVYPLLTRGLGVISGDEILAGLLIANLASLAFLIVFHQLLKLRWGGDVAIAGVVSFVCFPTAYFMGALYSESMLLLLVAASWLALEKDRLVLGAALSGIGAATRFVGVFSWAAPGLYALAKAKERRWRIEPRYLAAAVLLVVPLGIYCLYLWDRFGDPVYFIEAEKAWSRTLSNPLSTTTAYFGEEAPHESPFHNTLDLASTIIVFAVLIAGFRKVPFAWWLFSLLAVLAPALTGTLTSMPRYALSALALFVIMGRVLDGKPWLLRGSVWGASIVLQGILSVVFITGRWTA